tara:strand:- start:33299 stop:34150 length:852 start_codon:yes stop_codon:yes gene_type:complete
MTSTTSHSIPVLVAGALGRMGSEVIKAVVNSSDCNLIGAIETNSELEGQDVGIALGLQELGVQITNDFEGTLCTASQSVKDLDEEHAVVLVDFTHPSVVFEHTRASIAYGVHPVIGTTGLTPQQLQELDVFSQKASISAAVIPNFSVGMVLLQQAASAAASFYEHAELIELHHNQKADAPSGTCIKTAELIEDLGKNFNLNKLDEIETLKGSRGGLRPSGLRIHSLRLPGLVAHQEVLFGAPGETYLLKHDTIERSAYMPGVLLTIRKIRKLKGLVYGLERLL